MKQERLHRGTGVPLVTWWRSEGFAVVQEGGVLVGLTVQTLPASVFKWPPHVTLTGYNFHHFPPSIC